MHKQFPNSQQATICHWPYTPSRYPVINIPATWLSLERFAICGKPVEASRTIGYYSYGIRLRIADHTVQ